MEGTSSPQSQDFVINIKYYNLCLFHENIRQLCATIYLQV